MRVLKGRLIDYFLLLRECPHAEPYQKKIQKKQKKRRTRKYMMKKSIKLGVLKLRLLFGSGVGLFVRL